MADINTLLDEIIQRYQPGGEFGKASLATLEQRKEKTLASQRQSLVSAGLSGTTIGAGLSSKFEQEVGSPFRLGVEEQRIGGLTQAMQAKAGFLERAEERKSRESIAQRGRISQEQMAYDSRYAAKEAAEEQTKVSAWEAHTARQRTEQEASFGGQLSNYGADYYGSGGDSGGGMGLVSTRAYQGTMEGGGGSQVASSQAAGGEGTTSMTIEFGGAGPRQANKTIQVPASALGSGPGGLKDAATYKQYVPWGWKTTG